MHIMWWHQFVSNRKGSEEDKPPRGHPWLSYSGRPRLFVVRAGSIISAANQRGTHICGTTLEPRASLHNIYCAYPASLQIRVLYRTEIPGGSNDEDLKIQAMHSELVTIHRGHLHMIYRHAIGMALKARRPTGESTLQELFC